MIEEVLLFLEGRTAEVRRRVKERMELASESLDFERAAELRDALNHLRRMEEPTSVQVMSPVRPCNALVLRTARAN